MSRPVARTTAQAYATVTPDEPLRSGDDRYVPLDSARGTLNVARMLMNRTLAQEQARTAGMTQDHACFLVTGHPGCGKTTELHRLKDLLTDEKLAVVYFDAEAELNLQTLDWSNVLLETVWQMDDQLSREPYNLKIPDQLMETASEWLARIVTRKTDRSEQEASLDTEAGVDAGLPFLIKLKALVRGSVKTGSSTVQEIQQEAERRPNVLRQAINDIIVYTQEALRDMGYRGLVIIVDGLEKIPLLQIADRLTTHNRLFIYGSSHLKSLPCHLVYTLPLALLSSANVGQFPEQPVVMPMVHVRHPNGKEDAHALSLLAEVVKRRVAPELFTPGVIKMFALASGGHIRDFLRLVREAAGGFGERITKADARRAIAGLIEFYNNSIQQEFIEPLQYVVENNILPGSPHDGEMVSRLLVLSYHNDDIWNALHPCVKDAPRYVRSPRVNPEEASF